MPAVTVVVFWVRGGGVSDVRVLGEVGGAGVSHLGRVLHVLAVVGELDVGRGSVPLAVTRGVPGGRGVRETGVSQTTMGQTGVGQTGVGETGVSVTGGVRAMEGCGVGGGVLGLQVGDLGGVDDATVVGEGSGAVFMKS